MHCSNFKLIQKPDTELTTNVTIDCHCYCLKIDGLNGKENIINTKESFVETNTETM